MNFKHKNIGFFDSGIGGISVLKNAIKLLENEVFIYFGDSKNAPYGNKTQNEIIELCTNICNFLIYENNCKAIVVACNTASSAAIKFLRDKYEPNIPIIGIEPAIKPAIEYVENNKLNGKILVLATPFTINGDKFKKSLSLYKNFKIESVALEELAYMIEETLDADIIYNYLNEKLGKYVKEVECVVLGCTHYNFIKDVFKNIFGDNVKIFDGIYGTNKELIRRLKIRNIENNFESKDFKKVYIYNSLNDQKINRCYNLLNLEVN